jgi:hypothetical protein
MKRLIVLSAFVLVLAFPAQAAAGQPDSPSCWGAASADFAQSSPGALGEHASSFPTPRLGIGNVAAFFTGTHQPGNLAEVLGFSCD